MKKLFTLFAMLTLLVSLNAQTINYQAVLRDTIDGKIELVRNQKLYATISLWATINGDPTEVTAIDSMPCKTNADGMVDLKINFSDLEGQLSDAPDGGRGRIDWRNNVITAKFEYGESNSIVLETPVTAVPYAIQAKDGILTTSVITNYINSTAGGEQADFDSVWNAVMRNEQLRKAINDSIVEFLKQKENYEIAKDIIYGYLSQVSSADVREAYNLARSLDTATKDTIIFVMKDFVNTHHKLVIEALEYYAQTATEEEMRSIYETLKTRVGTTVKDLLYQYFNHYMETKGLVCQGKNLCDAIAAMNAGGSSNQGGNNQSTTDACEIFGDVVGCAGDNVYKFKVSFNLSDADNANFTATYVANSTNPTPLDVVVDGNTCYVEISNNNTYQSATVTVTFYYGADCSVSMTVVPSQELQPCGEQW